MDSFLDKIRTENKIIKIFNFVRFTLVFVGISWYNK
ncbi:hypothetical protein LLT1_11415 [Lactococcus cremoris subsp. cremoris TIFN1]|uniref:Uncharacterized protein n=1 Tax=Lactococcus cremoris subsp. cremoris TIFN3 TaxID=1234873 RepID=T0WP41_LACLC|nr:hypothetical protein LLT1_11415 [Lactococcus cremoris subsp. cremoris TIFN1]EQC94974.1 hypothetical protein LLT3_06120 [Lactococcus cremoris subsp. cremoris TIFN3]